VTILYNNPRDRVAKQNQVTVNGESRNFPETANLSDVVRELKLEPERVAVELNRAIVKRDLWASTLVGDGAEIEIVQFVGGG
jgi:thiamine biosynthesis protein ThiS